MRRLLLALAVVLAPAGARAAITYVGAGTLRNTTGNGTTGAPTGDAAGDLCLVVSSSNDAQTHTITSPSGWTELVQGQHGTLNQFSIFYRFITSGTETAPTVSRSVSTARIISRMLCWRGVDPNTNPYAGTLQTNTTTAGGTLGTATPALTTTANNALKLHIFGFTNVTNATAAVSSPTGINGTTYSSGFSAGGTSTTRNGLGIYSAFQASAGTTGTSNVTTTQADKVMSVTVALNPQTVYSDSFTEAVTAADSLAVTSGEPLIDAGFPVTAQLLNTSSTSMTSPSFTTGGAERLIVAEACFYPPSVDPYPVTMAWVGGTPAGASDFTLQVYPEGATGSITTGPWSGAHDGTIHWTCQIWTATTTSVQTSQQVIATRNGAAENTTGLLAVYSIAGASGIGARAQHHTPMSEVNGANQPILIDITASASKSIILGILQWGNLAGGGSFTPYDSNTVIDYQMEDGGADGGCAAFRFSGVTSASSTYTLGVTASQYAWSMGVMEVLAAASGPATYSDSFTEAASAGDSLAQNATMPQSYSEGATAGDSLTGGLVLPDAYSEAATAGDSLASARTTGASYSEGLTAGDSVAQVATMPQGVSEAASPGDSLAAAALRPVSFSEASSPGDSLADDLINGGQTYSDSYSEAVTAGDALASSSAMPVAYSEGASPADSLAQVCTMPQSVSEGAAAGDSLASSALLPASFSEAAAPGDSLAVAALRPVAFTEAASLAEQLAQVGTFPGAFSEAVTPGDSLADSLNGGASQYQDAFTEAVSAGDSLAHAAVMPEVLAEGATAGDAMAAGAVYPVAISEPATAGDSLAAGRVMPEAVTEVAVPGDNLLSTATLTAAFTEAVAALDSWVASGGTAFGLDQAPRILLRLVRPALYLYLPRPVLELDVVRPAIPLQLPR